MIIPPRMQGRRGITPPTPSAGDSPPLWRQSSTRGNHRGRSRGLSHPSSPGALTLVNFASICAGDSALDALVESECSIAISAAAFASASSSSSLAATAAAACWVFALSRLAFLASFSFATFFSFAASSTVLSADSLFSTFTLESFFRSTDDVSSVRCWSGGPCRLRKFAGIRNVPNLLCFAKLSSWSYIELK